MEQMLNLVHTLTLHFLRFILILNYITLKIKDDMAYQMYIQIIVKQTNTDNSEKGET